MPRKRKWPTKYSAARWIDRYRLAYALPLLVPPLIIAIVLVMLQMTSYSAQDFKQNMKASSPFSPIEAEKLRRKPNNEPRLFRSFAREPNARELSAGTLFENFVNFPDNLLTFLNWNVQDGQGERGKSASRKIDLNLGLRRVIRKRRSVSITEGDLGTDSQRFMENTRLPNNLPSNRLENLGFPFDPLSASLASAVSPPHDVPFAANPNNLYEENLYENSSNANFEGSSDPSPIYDNPLFNDLGILALLRNFTAAENETLLGINSTDYASQNSLGNSTYFQSITGPSSHDAPSISESQDTLSTYSNSIDYTDNALSGSSNPSEANPGSLGRRGDWNTIRVSYLPTNPTQTTTATNSSSPADTTSVDFSATTAKLRKESSSTLAPPMTINRTVITATSFSTISTNSIDATSTAINPTTALSSITAGLAPTEMTSKITVPIASSSTPSSMIGRTQNALSGWRLSAIAETSHTVEFKISTAPVTTAPNESLSVAQTDSPLSLDYQPSDLPRIALSYKLVIAIVVPVLVLLVVIIFALLWVVILRGKWKRHRRVDVEMQTQTENGHFRAPGSGTSSPKPFGENGVHVCNEAWKSDSRCSTAPLQ